MRGLKILSFRTGLERESRPTRIIHREKNHTPEINLPRVRGLTIYPTRSEGEGVAIAGRVERVVRPS